ncbi:metallophosphoesterase family protein [Paenibacillus sp. UNC451MF]|uniref:metallophosphoesterase family protein n=1 Tax=Paenibacillus sp. UNC451MF TaxID=1449063 RepID=UPI0004906023|nr:metallophosphoesterase [Paenibacillus sp. UNC451MF]
MKKWTLTMLLTVGALFYGLPQAISQAEEKPDLTFSVLSDLHIQAWDTHSQDKFINALNDLNQINSTSDALILNGDLTDGRQEDYDKLKKLLDRSSHPQAVYSNIGNHEFYQAWHGSTRQWSEASFPNGETEKDSIERFLKFNGESEVYYEKQLQGYSFIFLGSEQYRQSNADNLEDAYLSQIQLEWLKTVLKKAAASEKPIFVFLHQPLPNTVSGTTACCVNNRGVIQHEELNKILSAYPQVILFTGHTHWELKLPKAFVYNKYLMVNTSSVEQPWTGDASGAEKPLEPEASEGLYVEARNNSVTIRGRDFNKQNWIPEAHYVITYKK